MAMVETVTLRMTTEDNNDKKTIVMTLQMRMTMVITNKTRMKMTIKTNGGDNER